MAKKQKKMFSKVGHRIGIYCPNHPKASGSGYILYSRFLIENKLGRILGSNECIHHINRNKIDNRIENLQLLTRSEHTKLHWREDDIKPGQKRKLDYGQIEKLIKQGLGYRKIAKITGYKMYSVRYACRIIKRGR